MTVAPPVLPRADVMEVTRSYQPAARSIGRVMVLSALLEVRSVTRRAEERRVSEWGPRAFKAATLAYGPVKMAARAI